MTSFSFALVTVT